MLIKVSASRFTGKPGKTDRRKTGWPCLCATITQKSPARGKRPLRAPVRHAFFRCVARTFSALRILFSAAKGCAPPVRPAVLPRISPNIADQPERTPGSIETQRQRMARAFRISPTLRLRRALQERRTPLDPPPRENSANHARLSASGRMPTLPSTEPSSRETRRACNTPDARAKNA